jgi:hypothetical protein
MGKCTWCNCPDEEHDYYVECPLIDGKLLCDVCCKYNIMADDAVDFVKGVTNKDITRGEIIDTCRNCVKKIKEVTKNG